jgi:hypothetical protein
MNGIDRPSCLDFAVVNAAARSGLATLLARWLPDGRVKGKILTEWSRAETPPANHTEKAVVARTEGVHDDH